MRGLLVFNDNHELLYLKADKQLRSSLKQRQSELHYSSAVGEENVHAISGRSFDGCDSITVAYVFLPLIVCYESMKCMKFDRYLSIKNANICFHFAESKDDNRLLLIAIGEPADKKEDIQSILDHFINALDFVFGPLSCSMANPSMATQLDLLNYIVHDLWPCDKDESCENSHENLGFIQSMLGHLDASGLSKDNAELGQAQKSPITSALACVGGQFQAFLKCQLCFLVRKGVVLSTYCGMASNMEDTKHGNNGRDALGKSQMLGNAWQLITLFRTASQFMYSTLGSKKESEPTCYYCCTIALRYGPPSDQSQMEIIPNDVFSDVFRIDLSNDVHLICITPVTHGDLICDLTKTVSMIERLDRLRFEKALLQSRKSISNNAQSRIKKLQIYSEFWLNQLDTHTRLLCDRLDDRLIFMDGTKSKKLAANFQGIQRNLHTLTSMKLRRPDVTKVSDGEETSTLKSLRRLSNALLLDTFSSAVDEAKRYKLEKLERCWRNLSQSDFYSSTVSSLTDLLPSFSMFNEGPPATRFTLDALAYVFLLPNRRLMLFNGISHNFTQKQRSFVCKSLARMIIDNQSDSEVTLKMVLPHEKQSDESDHLMIFLSTSKYEKRNQSLISGGFLSKLASAIGQSNDGTLKRTSLNDSSSMKYVIKEPLAIMCAYDRLTHKDLAWRETRILAIHLYELMLNVRMSFY